MHICADLCNYLVLFFAQSQSLLCKKCLIFRLTSQLWFHFEQKYLLRVLREVDDLANRKVF